VPFSLCPMTSAELFSDLRNMFTISVGFSTNAQTRRREPRRMGGVYRSCELPLLLEGAHHWGARECSTTRHQNIGSSWWEMMVISLYVPCHSVALRADMVFKKKPEFLRFRRLAQR
jgi:hypothetical protein